MIKPWEPTYEEIRAVTETIVAARQVQTFLWGEANGNWGLEEWLRMFRKRLAKLEEVRADNPHAAVEIKKRLLQVSALSVALIGIIDRDGVPWEASPDAPPSNLPGFASPVLNPKRMSVPSSAALDFCDCWEGVNDREGMQPCEHERMVAGHGPFDSNTRTPGLCRCGAEGPPWRHNPGCAYD